MSEAQTLEGKIPLSAKFIEWLSSSLPKFSEEEKRIMKERQILALEMSDDIWDIIRENAPTGAYQTYDNSWLIDKERNRPAYPCFEAAFGCNGVVPYVTPIIRKSKLVKMEWDLSGEMSVRLYKSRVPDFKTIEQPLKEIFDKTDQELYLVNFKIRTLYI